MTDDAAVHSALLSALPHLRNFAKSLCRDNDRADDLVQQTFLLAWSNLGSFETGSNMMAWLVTILRNRYFTEYRKLRREIEDVDGSYAEERLVGPSQVAHLELAELAEALADLPDDMRRAVTLVGVEGYTYEEAARVCECSVGTIKSRAHRGRYRLADMLSPETRADARESRTDYPRRAAGERGAPAS